MCGIAGFANMPENWRENIHRMNERMYHRGPDSEGIWASKDAAIVLGHRRLSILDLSPSGSQPMISASGRYVIALNGEIYNYKKIRECLQITRQRINFRGTSDTEVLLEACEEFGFEDTLKLVKGMFAIALYDTENQILYLARDRMGEKPLYYGFLDGRFVFASDIAVIRENQYFKEELDFDALNLYFRLGYIPAPYTVYRNVKKLDAGSILELKAPFKKEAIHKYWDIMQIAANGQKNLFKGSEAEAEDRLENLLKEAVKEQMVADVPVGAFLSGGIDSTAVVAIMQSLCRNKVKTFTIGLSESAFNEAIFAKETAKYLGTEHTELYISDKEVQAVIPQLAYMYGEPFADSSQIPTYLVSKLAKEKVTVSLSGDGGDEMFCGYDSYVKLEEIWKRIKYIPLPIRAGFGDLLQVSGLTKLEYFRKVAKCMDAKGMEDVYTFLKRPDKESRGLVKKGEFPSYKYSEYLNGFLKQGKHNIMLMDLLVFLPDDILVKVDRAAMAVSLETRIPLLDKDIIEYAWSLPLEYKFSGNVRKKILRNVLYRYIPREMMERPKTGFSVPVSHWIRHGDLREWAEELLSSKKIRKDGILDEKIVERKWKLFLQKGIGEPEIWRMLMFGEWYRFNH